MKSEAWFNGVIRKFEGIVERADITTLHKMLLKEKIALLKEALEID